MATVNEVLGKLLTDTYDWKGRPAALSTRAKGVGRYTGDKEREAAVLFDIRGSYSLPTDDLASIRLEYILREAIDNSLAAYRKQGKAGAVRVTAVDKGDNVFLLIDDLAGGIPPEVKEHMVAEKTVVMSAKREVSKTAGGRGYKSSVKAAKRLGGDFSFDDLKEGEEEGTRCVLRLPYGRG